ncbi:MAG: hypothetical protein LKK16_00255 [Bacteroidales bacterium]|nr:hypothetical protein [Bacteroidales bacterium]MCH3940051.1 hypothetical protein [Bacteroidales bacterium]MCI2134747.1 hypothetical protein [Bacteroidales bacterium]
MIINRGPAHPYENQAGWAIGLSEYIDYQAYKKRLLLTLSIDFNREDGIYQGARKKRRGRAFGVTWMVFRGDEGGRAGTESGSG